MRAHAILFAFCLFATYCCYAQNADTLSVAGIRSYPDPLFLWPVLKQRSLNFRVRDLGENRALRYKPNNAYTLGVGAYVFDISFELTFAIPVNERDRRIYGKST